MFGELFFASLLPAFLVTISVYVCLEFLQFADMTCDGSFTLGACSFVTLFGFGVPDIFALIIIFLLGCSCGLITSFMINKININPLLSGIITMTALQSVSYIALQYNKNINFDNTFMFFSSLYYTAIFIIAFIALIYIVLRSEYGTILKVFSQSPDIIKTMKLKNSSVIYLTLIITNGIIAVAGALFIQTQQNVSTTTGEGAIIGGIIAVIIGANLFKTKTFFKGIIACVIGTLFYRTILEFATHENALSLAPELKNIMTATIIVLLFAIKDFRIIEKNNQKM